MNSFKLIDSYWKELEWNSFTQIKGNLDLSKENYNRMELHSVLQVITQLKYVCFLIGMALVNDEHYLSDTLLSIKNLELSLWDDEKLHWALSKLTIFKEWQKELENKVIPRLIQNNINNTKVDEYIHIMKKLISNWQIPIKDFLNRQKNDGVINFNKNYIEKKLRPILISIAANSNKSNTPYGFTFDKSHKRSNDYFVNINFKNSLWINDINITLPAIFEEILRDWILNARKYSKIWSEINVLFEIIDNKNCGENIIKISIGDNWIWIPEEDLQNIIYPGFRWWNVDKKTSWFWLWMTKMYYYLKKFGGNLYVKTTLWKWSEFILLIPEVIT
jgi:hypothetical protein